MKKFINYNCDYDGDDNANPAVRNRKVNLFDWNYWLVIINTKPLLVWGHWIIAKTNIRKYKNSVLYMPSLFLSCRCALCDYVVPIIRCVYEEAFPPLYLPVFQPYHLIQMISIWVWNESYLYASYRSSNRFFNSIKYIWSPNATHLLLFIILLLLL